MVGMLSLFAQLNSRSLDPAQDLSRIAAAGHLTSTDDYRELAPACSLWGLEKVRDELGQLLFVRRELGENNEVHFLIDKLYNLLDVRTFSLALKYASKPAHAKYANCFCVQEYLVRPFINATTVSFRPDRCIDSRCGQRSRSQPLLSTTTAHSVPKLAQYRRRR